MRKHYERILHDSESRVQRYLEIQILDENSPFCGGFPKADSLAEPKTAIYRATTMTACYLNPESRYYLDAELGRRLALALAFVRRSQRPGGYFDLINCNFFSGPDTAFCTKRLLPAYVYLCKVVDGALPAAPEAKAAAAELKPRYEAIIRDAADALCHCGFHTPNHRWAIASVLMLCAKLFDKPECRTAAEAILKEGNDCNEDGEYAERSAGNYNRINNDAMIMLAVATGDESYYAPVLRNLEMMLTYIDPDDSILTNNSTRWDMGKKIYPREYYLEYLYMGYTCRKPELLDAANAIMQMVERHALRSFDCLINLMLLPELAALEHEGCATPTNYHKYYEGSGIVRCRRGSWSYTILNNSPSFLFFQHGDFTLTVRIGASFCEHRNFVPATLAPKDGGYAEVVRQKAREKRDCKPVDLVYLGRMSLPKNPLEFCKIVCEVKRLFPNITARMIGDGELMPQVKEYICCHELEDIIELVGFQSNPYPYLNAGKVMVMPSIWEGFGLAAVEGMCLGKPVVCSGVGGMDKIIDASCGAKCRTTDEYSRILVELLNDNTVYEVKSKNAMRKSGRYTDMKKYADDICRIYKATIER